MKKTNWIIAALVALLGFSPVSTATAETFEQWIDRNGVPAGLQDLGDDPAGDGVSNLVKYALGLEPMVPARSGLPNATVTNIAGQDRLTLSVSKNPSAVGAAIIIEVSSDLLNWSAEEIETLNETSTLLEVADTMSTSDTERRFLRLRIEPPVGQSPDAFLYVAGGRTLAVASAKNWDFELDLVDLTASYANDPAIGPIDARSVLIADVNLTDLTVTNWRRASNALPAVHPEDPLGVLQWNYLHDAVNSHKGRVYVGPAGFLGTANLQEDGSRRIIADVVVWADIDPVTGDLGEFSASPRLPNNPRIVATAIVEVDGVDYFYVLGGSSDLGTTDTAYFAAIDAESGAIGEWATVETPLLAADWFNSAIGDSGNIILSAGNLRGVREVDWATPESGGNLTWAAYPNWETAIYSPGDSRWDHAMLKGQVEGQTYVYLVAGTATGEGTLATVNFAQLTDGVPGEWAESNPMPAPRRRLAGAAFADMIVMPGGSTSGSFAAGTDTVFIGSIGSDGEVTWSTSETPMFQYRSFHGATIAPAGNVD